MFHMLGNSLEILQLPLLATFGFTLLMLALPNSLGKLEGYPLNWTFQALVCCSMIQEPILLILSFE